MTQSVTESSISPGPLSPFSIYSTASGITSDDAPDLGAFGPVFRALTNLQTRGQPNGADIHSATPTSSFGLSLSDDSDPLQDASLWSTRRVTPYISYSLPGSPSRGRTTLPPETDETASEYDDGTELEVPIEDEIVMDRPSLGYLDQALAYVQAEREKHALRRELLGNGSTTSDSPSQLVIPVLRKKRRRNRPRSSRRYADDDGTRTETAVGEGDGSGGGADEASADNEDGDSSSSFDVSSSPSRIKTTPATPAAFRREKQKQRAAADHNSRLPHSRSFPNLSVSTLSFEAPTIQLRNLAHKLRLLFPSEQEALQNVLARESTSSLTYVDPRGPAPRAQDTLIHVFIDHSNILIGFINYARRNLSHVVRKNKHPHLFHAALTLVLERGRPITRRVLVTSSPLYQPMESAEQLGYEVRIYARVPDTGDGADRQQHQGHARKTSRGQNGGNHIDGNAEAGPSRSRGKARAHPRGHAHKTSVGGASGSNSTSTESEQSSGQQQRTRYREQGVDELLQLKLHQAIADADVVPPGATIVLATGDGNVGQFNEEGFIGCVKLALKKGWHVELYAWEGGLSRAWNREFGTETRFKIHMLDGYAQDLLEIPEGAAGVH